MSDLADKLHTRAAYPTHHCTAWKDLVKSNIPSKQGSEYLSYPLHNLRHKILQEKITSSPASSSNLHRVALAAVLAEHT